MWGVDDVTFSECHHLLSPSETDPINHFYWDFIHKHLTASTSKGNKYWDTTQNQQFLVPLCPSTVFSEKSWKINYH